MFRNRIARLSLEVGMTAEPLLEQFAPGVRIGAGPSPGAGAGRRRRRPRRRRPHAHPFAVSAALAAAAGRRRSRPALPAGRAIVGRE